ncbi:MAG: phosphatidylglycerophosphatase A [Bacteroidota bacterium]
MQDNKIPRTSSYMISQFFATGFYSGYSPVASGTAGSLVGLLLYAIPGMEQLAVLSIATIITFALGVFTSGEMEKIHGDDPSIVVIDEIVGMWISLLFLPKGWIIAVFAFIFFRIYDIIKPPPARQVEHISGGWGIMLDDVFAGMYANISVQIIHFIFPALK